MEQMRQEFTANVSHELKTPLTSISGYAEMIENGMAKQDDVQRFATIIHKEAGRLLTLISDIIQLSAMDESKTIIAKTPVDLLELAEECADILTLSAQQHQVSLHVQGKSATVMGNHDLLAELVYNLCDNAIRYNKPNGSVTILVQKDRLTVKDKMCIRDSHMSTKISYRLLQGLYICLAFSTSPLLQPGRVLWQRPDRNR